MGSGLTLSGGTVHIDNGGRLNFSGTQSLLGTGTVSFTEGSINVTSSGGALTIAAGIMIDGKEGDIYNTNLNAGSGTIDNQGTIDADSGGGSGLLDHQRLWRLLDQRRHARGHRRRQPPAHRFLDQPKCDRISVDKGSSLSVRGSWTNVAPFTLSAGSTLNISGAWSDAQPISASGGSTVNLSGTWTNSGTITLDDWNLNLSGTTWSNSGTSRRRTAARSASVAHGRAPLPSASRVGHAQPGRPRDQYRHDR